MYPKTWPPSLHLIEKSRNSALKYYKHWISYCTYNVAEATDAHALSTRSHLFLPWKTLTSGWEFKEERRGTAGHPPPVPWKVRWFLWSRAPALCYLICSFQLLKWCRHTAYDDNTFAPIPSKTPNSPWYQPLYTPGNSAAPTNIWRARPRVHTIRYLEKSPRQVWGRGGSLLLCFSHDQSLAGGATPSLGGGTTSSVRRHPQLDRRWYSQVGRLHLLIFCRAEERAMRTLVHISMHCWCPII